MMLSDWRGFLRPLDLIGHRSWASPSPSPRPGEAVLGPQLSAGVLLSSCALSPHTLTVLLTLPQQGFRACLFP